MTNKKNNPNKKNTEGPTMNGNASGTTAPATTVQTVVAAAALAQANQANNNAASNATSSSSSTPPTSTSTTTTTTTTANNANSTSTTTSSSSQNHHHQTPHQRLSSSSSQGNNAGNGHKQQQQQQQPLKKTQQHNDVDKISNSGSQASQGSYRGGGGGGKDHRARDKEKENVFRNYRTSGGGGGGGHHHQNIQNNSSGGGGQNLKNGQRQKEKNRDHSSTSHRSGGYSNYGAHSAANNSHHYHHNQPSQNSHHFSLGDKVKATGFPPLTSSAQNSPVPTTPTVVAHQNSTNATASPPNHSSKTVQTEPMEQKEVRKVKRVRAAKLLPEQHEMIKKIDSAQDTVMAFKEHDECNKIELMCELVSFLSPVDLRLLGNCIEGSVRCYTNQMRPVEKTANCAEPTASLPPYVCEPPKRAPVLPATHTTLAAQQNVVLNAFHIYQTTQPIVPGPPGLSMPIQKLAFPIADPSLVHAAAATSTPSSSSSVPATGQDGKMVNGTARNGDSATGNKEKLEKDTPRPATNSEAEAPTPTPMTSSSSNSAAPAAPASAPNGSAPLSVATSNGTSGQQPSPNQATPTSSETPVPQDPERFLESVKDLTSYVYILISVCASTNRKSAAKIADYVSKVILREKNQILDKIPKPLDKIEVLQDIGKIVAAIVHHPAISVDNKIKYNELRGSLRAEIECLYLQYYDALRENERKKRREQTTEGVGREEESGEESEDEETEEEEDLMRVPKYQLPGRGRLPSYSQSHSSPPTAPPSSTSSPTFFITRFIGRQTDKDSVFSLEIQWSDGDRTFTQRTRDQLKALQHRLLDEFGQQRTEKCQQMSSSMSSFDEESKKLSASTSTMETSFAISGDRILPRFPRDPTPSQVVQYINELSDLPARMMLSAVICEEFNGTRARSDDLLQESRESPDGLIFSRWKNPRAKSPLRYYSNRTNTGDVVPIELPYHLEAFKYSGVRKGHVQTLFPSCSNCGGQHEFKNCDKITLLDKKVEHKLRLEPDGSQLTATSNPSAIGPHPISIYSAGTSTSSGPVAMHQLFMDPNGQILVNPMNQHFAFHHNQQQQQQQLQQQINGVYSMKAPYRQNGGHFEAPIVMYHANVAPVQPPQQQQAPPPPPSSSSSSSQNQPPPPPPPSAVTNNSNNTQNSGSSSSNPGRNGGNTANF